MKVKIKTWEQFEAEFKPHSRWEVMSFYYCIKYKGFHWHIDFDQKVYFGREIEVEKASRTYETHIDKFGNPWHELWFASEFENFFKEEEFMI